MSRPNATAQQSTAQQVMGPGNNRTRLHSQRLLFDGVTENYEKWEVKFIAHLRLKGPEKVGTEHDR